MRIAYAYKNKVEKSNQIDYKQGPMSKKTTIITLRVPESLAEKIALAVGKSGRDQADILRDALDLGIDDLFMVGLNPLDLAKQKIKEIKQLAEESPTRQVRALRRPSLANHTNTRFRRTTGKT